MPKKGEDVWIVVGMRVAARQMVRLILIPWSQVPYVAGGRPRLGQFLRGHSWRCNWIEFMNELLFFGSLGSCFELDIVSLHWIFTLFCFILNDYQPQAYTSNYLGHLEKLAAMMNFQWNHWIINLKDKIKHILNDDNLTLLYKINFLNMYTRLTSGTNNYKKNILTINEN